MKSIHVGTAIIKRRKPQVRIAHCMKDPDGVRAALADPDCPHDVDFYDLDADMAEFDRLYRHHHLPRLQRQAVIAQITLLEFVTLERLHERWQVFDIKPEDLRAELFGAVCFWEQVLRTQHVTHIFLHTIAPHWTYSYALFVAARLCGVHFFTVSSSFPFERPLVHLGIRQEVEPFEAGSLDTRISKFFDENSKETSSPKTVRQFLRTGNSWVIWGRNVARYIRKAWQLDDSGGMYAIFDRRRGYMSRLRYCWNYFRHAVRTQFQLHRLKRFYSKNAPEFVSLSSSRETFPIVFFAHLQPEAATCPNADLYHDARMIARELQDKGFTVYYKEHPLSFVRSISTNINITSIYKSAQFYKDLLAMGVRFIPSDTDNNFLLETFNQVATCTGTISLQAVLKGLPSVVFGAPWYMDMPGTIPARDGLQMTAQQIQNIEIPDHSQIKDFFRMRFGLGVPDPQVDGVGKHLVALSQIAASRC